MYRVRETRACSAAGIVGAIFRLRQDAQAILETGRTDVYGNLKAFLGTANLDTITALRVEEFQQQDAATCSI